MVSRDLPEHGVDYQSRYKDDHTLTKNLGFNAYRIRIEWSRIFPKSTANVKVGVERASDGNIADVYIDDVSLETLKRCADNKALDHYRAIIKDLRSKDIKVSSA